MTNKNNLSNIDGAEISWFAPLCDGDDDFLGNRNPIYKSVGCGYILNYTIESLIIEKDSNNWIDRYNIYKSNIENETTRHIEIFH